MLKKVKQGLIHPISWLCVDTMKFWIQPELSNEYLDRCGEYLEFLDAFNGWWIIKGGSNQSATRPQAPSPPRVWGIASWILEVAERSQKYIFSIQRNKMACFLLLWEKSKPREMKYCFQMRKHLYTFTHVSHWVGRFQTSVKGLIQIFAAEHLPLKSSLDCF